MAIHFNTQKAQALRPALSFILRKQIQKYLFSLLTNTFVCVIIYTESKEVLKIKSYSSREVIRILESDGWYLVRTKGSHHQFKHPEKKGCVTVKHPDKDIPRKTLDRIEEQSGLLFR